MKLDTIKNPNYVATVVRIEEGDLYPVLGLDNLKGYSKFGMQALVSKDTEPGLYILFSTEVQLSHDYVAANNLYRDSTLNLDPEAKGYLEQNRRVKAIKLRGNRSESLLMPVASLGFLSGKEVGQLAEGDVFDSIDGQEICRKYVPKGHKEPGAGNQPKARTRRVSAKVFPEHIDTASYFRLGDTIPANAFVSVTQKIHGTSFRCGNVPVEVPQKWWERLLRLPVRSEHRFVVGSRRVTKSVDLSSEEGKDHFYAEGDLWTRYADEHKLADKVPADHLVFGELAGWAGPGSPIQRNYTYDLPDGQAMLYVYRVAVVTSGGVVVDYTHEQMRQFCMERGLVAVPVMHAGLHKMTPGNEYLDGRYYDEWADGEFGFVERPVPLSNKKTVDEGVVVRWDGPHGFYALKAKSPKFLEHETKMLDVEAEDMEAAA